MQWWCFLLALTNPSSSCGEGRCCCLVSIPLGKGRTMFTGGVGDWSLNKHCNHSPAHGSSVCIHCSPACARSSSPRLSGLQSTILIELHSICAAHQLAPGLQILVCHGCNSQPLQSFTKSIFLTSLRPVFKSSSVRAATTILTELHSICAPYQLAPSLQILVRHGQAALLRDVEAVQVRGAHLQASTHVIAKQLN